MRESRGQRLRFVVSALTIGWLCTGPRVLGGQTPAAQPLQDLRELRVVKRDSPLRVLADRSLSEELHAADAVVTGRVLARVGGRAIDLRPSLQLANPDERMPPQPLYRVYTEYDFQLAEVLKPHPAVIPRIVRIASSGGTARAGDVIIEDPPHAPQLIEGQEYLLLLSASNAVNGPIFSESGVFALSGSTVEANDYLRTTRHGRELIGLTPRQALENVRLMLLNATH